MASAPRRDRNRQGMLLALLLPMAPALAAGTPCAPPHAVGSTQHTLVDPTRENRGIPVRLHYPASAAGAGTPALTGCGFPIIAFGHGFTIGVSAYTWLADGLAAAGFIVVMPATEGGLSPDHGEFGRDLGYLTEALSASSPWNQAAGNGRAIGGHSMGGGAAVLGVAGTSGIAALFALAPAQTNPSAISAASGIAVPDVVRYRLARLRDAQRRACRRHPGCARDAGIPETPERYRRRQPLPVQRRQPDLLDRRK